MDTMVNFWTLILFFSVVISLPNVNANNRRICPEYKSTMKNFDINRFLGRWHVIQNSDYDEFRDVGNFSNPDGDCYGYYYSQNSGNYYMNILNSKRRILKPFRRIGITQLLPNFLPNFISKYNGHYMNFTTINVTSHIMNFDGFEIVLGLQKRTFRGEHVVLNTDYDNFAVVMTCVTYDTRFKPTEINSDIPILTVAILYRNNEPNWQQIDSIRNDLVKSYPMISANDFKTVLRVNCTLPDGSFYWPKFSTWFRPKALWWMFLRLFDKKSN